MREVNVLADRLSRLEEGAAPPGTDQVLRGRFRTIVSCLGLTLIVMTTRPGQILADTKIDMAVNPLAFLGRAFHLWDLEQFGQLQNQAVGYLFPIGPFFLAGHLAGLAPWIVQRFWLALLLCLAFVGAQRLARRLGIGGPIGQLLGGLAYALGPHGVSSLGMSSWEYLPLAMLPWIMLPLIAPGSLRRAAALSGLAVACCGGINATATVAVLVVPFIFLVLRRAWRLTAWWSLATAIAIAWWLVPLVLTGRYGFSWLPYTEKAATTTSSTGLLDVLRGTERWANQLTDNGVISLPLGNAYAERPVMILLTVLMAALGVAGLLRRPPHRVFLISTLLAGVAIITAGHAGPLAPGVQQLLDGPLAALRNLYKFDAVVRLPLALGLAHLLTSLPRPKPRLAATVAATLALAGVALPALAAGTAGAGPFQEVPGYWRDAARWLNQRAGHQAVVALPGSRFGEYAWGRPMDDLVQPLLTARWGVRQLVPQGSPGYARIMNEIDQRVSVGEGSAGLTEMLARMGVRYLLVRNDLDRSTLAGAWPARVHAALDSSPGIRRAAAFGPQQGTALPDDGTSLFDQPYPAVEIYEVQGAASIAQLVQAQDPIRLAGGPEAMFALAESGLLGDRAVLLDTAGPGQSGPGQQVVSDAQLKRLRGLGQIRTQLGPVRTRADTATPPTAQGPDPSLPGWDRYETVAAYAGIKDVTASSSNADAGAVPMLSDASRQPYAAFDGSTATQWQSSAWTSAVGQWIQVEFTGPRELSSIQAAFIQASFLGPSPSSVSVETATGKIEQPVTASIGTQGLRVPAGPTRWVRIKVTGVSGNARTAGRVGISEITIPGVSARRSLELPQVSGDAVVLSATTGAANACMKGSVRWVCSSGLERGDSELGAFSRDFTSVGGQADVTGRAVVTDGELISRLLREGVTAEVSASSTAGADPAVAPRSAFDGDPSTSWISSQGDRSPTLIVNWPAKVTVGTIKVGRGRTTRPQPVTVQGSGGQVRHAVVDGNGLLEFAPMRTDRLLLIFKRIDYPVQIAGVDFPGAPRFHPADVTPVTLACGQGPTFLLNGRTVRTSAQGTLADLLAGRAFTYKSCSPAKVASGGNRLDLSHGSSFQVKSSVLDLGLRTAAPATELTPTHWGVADRTVEVDAAQASYLVVNENFNQGWRAELGGRILTPVTLDGWKQAWAVPAEAKGTVRLTYVPDDSYRLALVAGAALLLVLLAGAFLPERAARTFREPTGSWLPVLIAPALGFWSFGLPGLGMAVVAVVVVLRLRSAWLPAGVLLLGAGCAVWRPDLGELFPQLASVAVLAALCAGLRPGTEPHEGLLDQVVARRGDPDRQQSADGEVDQQVSAVGRAVGDGEPDGDHDELPEEDPVGDLPEEGHHPVPQDR